MSHSEETKLCPYCGKEIKRKLDQGLIEHPDADEDNSGSRVRCRMYEGKVTADKETTRWLSKFSERTIQKATGLNRRTIHLITQGKTVKASTVQKIADFRREMENTIHAV